MSGIFHRNIALMLVSIVVIPIMVYLNAPSPSIKIGSIRPRPNSPRMGAVVEAEVYASAEVALLVETMAMVVIEPKPAANERVMMLRCMQPLPQMVVLEKKWQILRVEYYSYLDITTNGSLTLSPFPFLPLIFSGLNQGRLLLRKAIVGL